MVTTMKATKYPRKTKYNNPESKERLQAMCRKAYNYRRMKPSIQMARIESREKARKQESQSREAEKQTKLNSRQIRSQKSM